ncbi:MAG TPA: chorismate mutase [Acidobacteriaceae bacterium]|jgi:chorismate mutase|nr:chorismate mutase [Acidobacteriaceae bacterium]
MDISDWRKKIDELDEQLVHLLNERTKAALEIGKLKKNAAMAIYEPGREKAVFDHVLSANPGPLPNEQLQHIYERIIDVMRTLQRNDKD